MKKLLFSFRNAFRGISKAIYTQRNLRIHICCMFYMYSFLLFFDFFTLTKAEFAVILIANILVVALELVNTAIETVVDLVTEEYQHLAKIAKDVAAGAVLFAIIFTVIIGVVLLYQPEAFRSLIAYYKNNPIAFVLFLLSFAITIPFTFVFGDKEDKLK